LAVNRVALTGFGEFAVLLHSEAVSISSRPFSRVAAAFILSRYDEVLVHTAHFVWRATAAVIVGVGRGGGKHQDERAGASPVKTSALLLTSSVHRALLLSSRLNSAP
jgi:hypothetical protein